MNTYEFTFLVPETAATTKLEKALDSLKGKKLDEKAWGKRLFAYPIDKKTDAYYFTWYIQIDSGSIAQFKKKLQYDKLVIRYLLIEKDYTQKVQKKTKIKKEDTKKE